MWQPCSPQGGRQPTHVYVDTGLMRKGETSEVSKMFSEMGIKLQVVDASARFFESLSGVTDPEEKRKIIGEQFIRVFEEEKEPALPSS